MKKILAHYPSVYYQVLLLFIVGEITFTCCSFDLSPLYDLWEISAPNKYKPLTVMTLYITAGIIVDKIRDFRNGILLAMILYVIGFLFTSVGFTSYQFLFLIGGIICNLAHGIFVIICMLHVGLLFPVANDWKDMAFMFLLIFPFLFDTIYSFFLNFNTNFITLYYSQTFFLFFLTTGLIFYFLHRFKDLGFRIEIIEEEDTEEELKEEKLIRYSMIGCVLVTLIFSFITKNLPNPENPQLDLIDFIYLRDRLPLIVFFIISFCFFIFWLTYFRTSKYQSNHSTKMITLSISLLIIGGLEFFIVIKEVALFYQSYLLIFYLILVPLILSIMTHVNIDKNIGLWLGVFFAIPFVVDQLKISFYSLEVRPEVLPYTSILLLILFILFFRENRNFIEKKLALNEPNREEDEGEEGVDILEHFIDK